jgi:hypothetical protein
MTTPAQKQKDATFALDLQLKEYGIPSGPAMPLEVMQMMAHELDRIKADREKKDAILAQQVHDQLNGSGGVVASGRGGVVASGRGGVGRADAMTDSEFQSWFESGGGSASDTYAERLEALGRMQL